MWLKASEPNSKSRKGSKRTSRCFLTLILNCFTTDPCWLLFEYACVSSSLVSTIVVAKVVYVRVGRRYQNKGEVLGLVVLVLSNINIVWEKSLSAPLISILTQYSVWHKVDEQLYLKVKHLKNVFCTVYVESGDVGLTSKFMEMGGRAHFFLSLVGSSSISALIWDSFIPAMRLILSRHRGGWHERINTHTPNPETCQDAGDTYFHTMAFSLALYFAFPFIQITCTPLVFRGVGIRTCSKHSPHKSSDKQTENVLLCLHHFF